MAEQFDINTRLDPKDQAILASRASYRELRPGPRVGDYCIMADGTFRRFTHDWGNDIQVTSQTGGEESFYLDDFGNMSYSGGLSSAVAKTNLVQQRGLRAGTCWFFHLDRHTAHNGVRAEVPCRVYAEVLP
jgi:hypothetical protein